MCRSIEQFLSLQPGCTDSELIDEIERGVVLNVSCAFSIVSINGYLDALYSQSQRPSYNGVPSLVKCSATLISL